MVFERDNEYRHNAKYLQQNPPHMKSRDQVAIRQRALADNAATATLHAEQQQRADAAAAAVAPPRYINCVAEKLPAFWIDNPAFSFAQAEMQFALADVTVKLTKYYHVISLLDVRAAVKVEKIISDPPDDLPSTNLRRYLIKRLSTSEKQRVRQLLHDEKLGDCKP
uniref:DUF7041 domain-containing protein n=1 Tax=Trichogramma kaykai TaxID=54128 RepID=A0ABD2XRN1_9HYME